MEAKNVTTKYGVELVNFNPQKIWDAIGRIQSDKYSTDDYEVTITYKVRPKPNTEGVG